MRAPQHRAGPSGATGQASERFGQGLPGDLETLSLDGGRGAGLLIKFSRMAVTQRCLILSVKRLCREDFMARRPVEPMLLRPRRNPALLGALGPRPVRWRSHVERRISV